MLHVEQKRTKEENGGDKTRLKKCRLRTKGKIVNRDK
jgi:hypothetical protein